MYQYTSIQHDSDMSNVGEERVDDENYHVCIFTKQYCSRKYNNGNIKEVRVTLPLI